MEETITVAGKGKMLLMDDKAEVRSIATQMLSLLGYEVTLAKNGYEVISLFTRAKKENSSFHAVILDATIRGGMGGKESLEEIFKIDPNVKAIITSGYSFEHIKTSISNEKNIKGFLNKPYKIEELSQLLKQVLISPK